MSTDPQPIPWDPDVFWFEMDQGREVHLYRKGSPVEAVVSRWGTFTVFFSWRLFIDRWMKYDPLASEALKVRYEQCRKGGGFIGECIHETLDLNYPPDVPKGVKEWRPPGEIKPNDFVHEGSLGWNARYIHFVSPTGHCMGIWHSTGLELWRGDADGFIGALFKRTLDDEVRETNAFLSNGLLWVLDYCFVLFTDPHEAFPEWACRLVSKDPDLLWPKLVDRLQWFIKNKPLRVAPGLKAAVEEWIRRHGEPQP